MKLLRQRYRPIETVARGGQGEVVRAIDEMHGRPVALKVRRVGPGAERERLLSEARVLLGIKPHPGLPLVRDDFFLRDRYYLVMDWVDGQSLQQILDHSGNTGLPLGTVVEYLTPVAGALDHLHGHFPPVVHADVKPPNIIVTTDGDVVLVDFGVARSAGEGLAVSGGTPGFAAPELGMGGEPSRATDVFGLAATSFALLTGRAPRPGLSFAPAGLPSEEVDRVRRGLERGLAFEPAHRPPAATAFVELLRPRAARRAPAALPAGTVTFLFTDIEGSTDLLRRLGPRYDGVLEKHRGLLRAAWSENGGREVLTEGDAFFVAFQSASDAVAAALDAQRAMRDSSWPDEEDIRVRMGLHTGEPRIVDDDYVGLPVNQASRIASAAHGGQVLLSRTTCELAELPEGASLVSLGRHRLKDFERPEELHQLCHADLPREFPLLRTEGFRAGNLPAPTGSLVGRDREREDARELLSGSRVVTLTGPGGVGKTRLAVQAGTDVAGTFEGGVWFVALAPVTRPSDVPSAVLGALSVRELPNRSILEAIREHVGERPTLLVLDNLEQVMGAVSFVADLLAACASLRVLVTSREPMRISGERELPVLPLAVPDTAELPSVGGLASLDSVALFVDRARSVMPGFALDEGNARPVAEICSRVDGLPLGIELAAARVKMLSPQALLDRLAGTLDALSSRSRDLPERHRTLRNAIAWSYDLLDHAERSLFGRLAVFAGGCSLEAAEMVAGGDDGDAADLLFSLIDKSLLRREETADGHSRLRMLETVREFGLEQLAASEGEARVRERHASWFADLARAAHAELGGADPGLWLERLDLERPNLIAALEWSLAHDRVLAFALCADLGPLWRIRGYLTEGREWLDRALAARPEAAARARLLRRGGVAGAGPGQSRLGCFAARGASRARPAARRSRAGSGRA